MVQFNKYLKTYIQSSIKIINYLLNKYVMPKITNKIKHMK